MKRLIFDLEHEQFRDSVVKFMQAEVAPYAEKWREEGVVPREVFLKAGQNGLLCTWADEKYGGAGIDDSTSTCTTTWSPPTSPSWAPRSRRTGSCPASSLARRSSPSR